MNKFGPAIGAIALTLTLGTVASAQGTIPGATSGAASGAAAGGTVGGPIGGAVGGIVGGAVGAATGTVGGILGVDSRPRFRSYVQSRGYPSYSYDGPFGVGAVLPGTGVSYYDVPADYGVSGYRYTIVNGRTVLVDPATRRIVEVVD